VTRAPTNMDSIKDKNDTDSDSDSDSDSGSDSDSEDETRSPHDQSTKKETSNRDKTVDGAVTPRTQLPPLLLPLSEREPERLHYIGSFHLIFHPTSVPSLRYPMLNDSSIYTMYTLGLLRAYSKHSC